jgi:prephenate dehydratase
VPRLAYLGPRATFTEQALRTLPESRDAELVPCAGTPAVLAAVRAGAADAGCVPIENSVEGAVAAVLDELVLDPALVIVREVIILVRFAVLVRPGSTAAQIRTVASHPHGEAQTRGWLAGNLPDADVVLTTSTAEAAAQVARGEVDAAVAAPIAAREHGLTVLADDVADTPDAVTRFGLLALPRPPGPPTGNDRTSLVATTENRPGALLGVLTELAVRGIDLSRIESRPIKDKHGEYWFHLDCTGHVAEPAMGEAMAALHRRCRLVRYLGSYPKALPPDGPPGAHSGDGGRVAEPVNGSGAERFAAAADWLARVRAGRSA